MKKDQHRLGQYYTSESKLLLNYKNFLLKQKNKVIIDPFCGEAHLLHFYLSLFNKKEQIDMLTNKKIIGYDIYEENIIHIRKEFKKRYNLSEKLLSDIFQVRDSFLETNVSKNSFILTNPPYLGKNICKKKYIEDFNKYFLDIYKFQNDYFEIALLKYSNNDGLWITPSNLFSSDIMQNIRKKIVNKIHNIKIYEEKTFENTDISVATYTIENNNITNKYKEEQNKEFKEKQYQEYLKYIYITRKSKRK